MLDRVAPPRGRRRAAQAAIATWQLLARAFDAARDGGGGDEAAAFARLATAVAKYWVCKRAPGVAYEAMEVCARRDATARRSFVVGGGSARERWVRAFEAPNRLHVPRPL